MALASSKHRKNTSQASELAAEGGVLETTNHVKTSSKRRINVDRPRNDEETRDLKGRDGQVLASQTRISADNSAPQVASDAGNAVSGPKGEGASPKRRVTAKRPRNDETLAAVLETTNKRGAHETVTRAPERPRNDEYSEDGRTIELFGEAGQDTPLSPQTPYVETDFAQNIRGAAAEGEASLKRRTNVVRPRNHESEESVLETTNYADAPQPLAHPTKRPRNDESKPAAKRGRPKLEPLTPAEDTDGELFICDVLDAIPKDDIPTMEHPIFTLATQPDMREIHYEHNGTIVDIWPSRLGLATIHDKDILIYCISQLIAKKNRGEPYGRKLRLQPYQLLTWARRQTSGDGYRRLVNALDRLSGTRIKTNIKTLDGIEYTSGVGLINEYNARRSSKTGQVIDVEITLSEWLFKMVEGANVLTLHRDYFLLRKSVDRRVYELARKHCGSQPKWQVGLETLKKKTGAGGTLRHFREDVRRLVATNHLPDYTVEFDKDLVTFYSRSALAAAAVPQPKAPYIEPDAFNDARLVAPGFDVYALHSEWVEWWQAGGCQALKDPTAAFLGFCKQKYARSAKPC